MIKAQTGEGKLYITFYGYIRKWLLNGWYKEEYLEQTKPVKIFIRDADHIWSMFDLSIWTNYKRSSVTWGKWTLVDWLKRSPSLVISVFCTKLYFLVFQCQDPSSPRSVQSYSSRENGLDKMPLSRKEGPPQASPTSLASSSSATSPSRGKEPPQVNKHTCMKRLKVGHIQAWTLSCVRWHWWRTHDPFQCRASEFLSCRLPLYSALLCGVSSLS